MDRTLIYIPEHVKMLMSKQSIAIREATDLMLSIENVNEIELQTEKIEKIQSLVLESTEISDYIKQELSKSLIITINEN